MKESKIKELFFDFFIFLCYNIYRKKDKENMEKFVKDGIVKELFPDGTTYRVVKIKEVYSREDGSFYLGFFCPEMGCDYGCDVMSEDAGNWVVATRKEYADYKFHYFKAFVKDTFTELKQLVLD